MGTERQGSKRVCEQEVFELLGSVRAPRTSSSSLDRLELQAEPRSEAAMLECGALCSGAELCGAFDLPILDEGHDPDPQYWRGHTK